MKDDTRERRALRREEESDLLILRDQIETCTAKVKDALKLAVRPDAASPETEDARVLHHDQRSLGDWIDELKTCLKDSIATAEDAQTENQILRSELKRLRNTDEQNEPELPSGGAAGRVESLQTSLDDPAEWVRREDLAQQDPSLAIQMDSDLQQGRMEAKCERDARSAQTQRLKTAYEDEIRVSHEKLMELQKALAEEVNLRCAVQDRLRQANTDLAVFMMSQEEELYLNISGRPNSLDSARRPAFDRAVAVVQPHECWLEVEHLKKQLSDANACFGEVLRKWQDEHAANQTLHRTLQQCQKQLAIAEHEKSSTALVAASHQGGMNTSVQAFTNTQGMELARILHQDFAALKCESDATLEAIRAEMAAVHRSRQSDLKKIESLSKVARMRDSVVEDTITNLEHHLHRTLEMVEKQQQHARAQGAQLRTSHVKAEVATTAAENMRRELDELSERYQNQKADKSEAEEKLQRSARALQELLNEREDEAKKGKARESRVRALTSEVAEVDDRLEKEKSARKQAERELDEVAAKLLAAQSNVAVVEAKHDQVALQLSESEQKVRDLDLEATNLMSRLESCQEENRRRKITAEESREALDSEVKKNKESRAKLEMKTTALVEAQNETQKKSYELRMSEEHTNNLQRKLDSIHQELSELQTAYDDAQAADRSMKIRVSNAECVEGEVRSMLRQAVSKGNELEHQVYQEARSMAVMVSKMDDFECTMKAVRERVDSFCAAHERTVDAFKRRYDELHDQWINATAAAAQFEAENRRLVSQLSQQSWRSHTLELSMRGVLEDAARAKDARHESTCRKTQEFKASLEKELLAANDMIEKLCSCIDPSMTRSTPDTAQLPRRSKNTRPLEDDMDATREANVQEGGGLEAQEQGCSAGEEIESDGDVSLVEALGVLASDAWTERGLAASAKALELNKELVQLRSTKDALIHNLESRTIETRGLKEDLDVVQRDLTKSELREQNQTRRAEELCKHVVELKEEARQLETRLRDALQNISVMEAVVEASCADQAELKAQVVEADVKKQMAESRVRELEEQQRSTSKSMLAMQLSVDAKDAQVARLEQELADGRTQLKAVTNERNDLVHLADQRESAVFKQQTQLTEANSSMHACREEKLVMQKQLQSTIANKNETIDGLREEVEAVRQDALAAAEEQQKLRVHSDALQIELEALQGECADVKLRLSVTLEREAALKSKVVENEVRSSEVASTSKQRVEELLRELQTAEHSAVLAQADAEQHRTELTQCKQLLETQTNQCSDLKTWTEQAVSREERLTAKANQFKELHEQDARTLSARDEQISKLEEQLFSVTKRMHQVHTKSENDEAKWAESIQSLELQAGERGKRIDHLVALHNQMYAAICGEKFPDYLEFTQLSDNLYHHSELSCARACERAAQLRENYKNSRMQIESIMKSVMNQDEHKAEKIRQYEDQVWALTVQIKELRDEQEEKETDEWLLKRIEMLEEDLRIKEEQTAGSARRLEEDMQRLECEHEAHILVIKRDAANELDVERLELSAMLDRVLLGSDLLLQTMAHARSVALHSSAHAMKAQEIHRQTTLQEQSEEACALHLLVKQVQELEKFMLQTHGEVLESRAAHEVTEANLAASRNHAERLQEQCQNLARERQEANERSLVMEVSLGQVLHDCHDLAGAKEEMCAMQRDAAECWGIVGELCASIEGGGQRVDAAFGAEWVVDTVGIKERSREACRRVADLYAQLMNVKGANKELQEDADLELQVAHIECVASASDASRRASDRERDNSTLQKSEGGFGERDCNDMTKDLVCRESSMLTYQIQRLRFEVGEIIADEETSQRRERELMNQVDGLVSQQQLMAVMVERICLAVAMHAEGNQAWRYMENAMQGNPISLWRNGLPEKMEEMCKIIVQMRDRLVAADTEADSHAHLLETKSREVAQAQQELQAAEALVADLKRQLENQAGGGNALEDDRDQIKALNDELESQKVGLERELGQALALLSQEHKAGEDATALRVLLAENEAAVRWLLNQIRNWLTSLLEFEGNREAASASADEAIHVLTGLNQKLKHLQNAPWWPMASGAGVESPDDMASDDMASHDTDAAAGKTEKVTASRQGSRAAGSMTSRFLRSFAVRKKREKDASTARRGALEAAMPNHSSRSAPTVQTGEEQPGSLTSADLVPKLGDAAMGLVAELHSAVSKLRDFEDGYLEQWDEAVRLVIVLDEDLSSC